LLFRISFLIIPGILPVLPAGNVVGQSVPVSEGPDAATPASETLLPKTPPNWKQPTLGGMQFWSDQILFHQWRLQRNVMTGHYRLLDDNNYRHAWGSLNHCQRQLARIRRQSKLPAMTGKAVILMHGLGHGRLSMKKMAQYLRKSSDFNIFNISYASTRQEMTAHAQSLARIVESLEGIDEIHFVAHSMGNLVIRRYLFDHNDPRIGRIVMLGPPNDGAQLAKRYGKRLYKLLAGQSGDQLGRHWDQLKDKLATPKVQFGIIAGSQPVAGQGNPLITGNDDLVVRVEETKLPGAADFAILPVAHSFLMNDATVQQYTLNFLQQGRFFVRDSSVESKP
jgi:pimeloyl-ACP methyl ester carboxylesterase